MILFLGIPIADPWENPPPINDITGGSKFSGTFTSGAPGLTGGVIVVGINPSGGFGASTDISFFSGISRVITSSFDTVILSTGDGGVTVTVTPDGSVIRLNPEKDIGSIFGVDTVITPGNPLKVTTGADTFTDTFGLISGNTGSTGLIFAPTSIVSLNTSVSTATPFPAINLSFPMFPVDFNILLPLLVP